MGVWAAFVVLLCAAGAMFGQQEHRWAFDQTRAGDGLAATDSTPRAVSEGPTGPKGDEGNA